MLKLVTFTRNVAELRPMLPLIRHLYHARSVEGLSILAGRDEWELDANPFIQRYYREYSLQIPPDPPETWFIAAAQRVLLEERPAVVVLPNLRGFFRHLCEMIRELGVRCLVWPDRVLDRSEVSALQGRADAVGALSPEEAVLVPDGFFRPLRSLTEIDAWLLEECTLRARPLHQTRPTRREPSCQLSESEDPRKTLAQSGPQVYWEPVNVCGRRHTFRYGDYDNEFALGPADFDLRQLCREVLPANGWRATVQPRSGAAWPLHPNLLEYPSGEPAWLRLEVLAEPKKRPSWLEPYRLPESKRLKVVFADSKNVAGSVINHCLTVNRYTQHEAMAICTERHPFITYSQDDARVEYLDSPEIKPEVRQFLEDADGFVFFDDDDETSQAWPVDLRPFVIGKPVVHLYVGWKVHDEVERLQRPGRRVLTPLPHVLRMFPNAFFYAGFPPASLDDMPLRPPLSAEDGILRVLHSPSLPHRTLSRYVYHKDTEAFLAASRTLKGRLPEVEFLQLGGLPHRQILQARQLCDITVNHLRGYISLAGDEAMYLERVLVHAFDQFSINRHREYWGLDMDFPWVLADPHTLEEVLAELLSSPQRRHELGLAGRRFMLEYFSPATGILPLLWHLSQAPVAQ